MIPKIAHYIWLGGTPYSDLVRRCIASFQEKLPDYQIIFWDDKRCEEVFSRYAYAREAYELKLFAFASDVVRLHALKEYGGIYLDTDYELFDSLDDFLDNEFFAGFENKDAVATAIMG